MSLHEGGSAYGGKRGRQRPENRRGGSTGGDGVRAEGGAWSQRHGFFLAPILAVTEYGPRVVPGASGMIN